MEKWNCLPKVLAIPVFTLSENTWEILFSCSGLASTTIRMFHSVWMATWVFADLIYCCSPPDLQLFVTATHLLEADVGDVPQDALQCFEPLSLSQRIFLSPNDVNIVWDMICCVILRLPLTLTLKPGVNLVGRTSISCGLFLDDQLCISQMDSITKCETLITHIPGANKHPDHVGFGLFWVFVLHLLKQLTEAFSFLESQSHSRQLKENKTEDFLRGQMSFRRKLWCRRAIQRITFVSSNPNSFRKIFSFSVSTTIISLVCIFWDFTNCRTDKQPQNSQQQ